jgi:hypothetical protein
VIISILIIIDAKLLGGFVIFRTAYWGGVSGERAGSIRLSVYVFPTIIAYFYLLSLIRFNKKPFIKFLSLISWLIITYQLLFCNLTRQLNLALFMTVALFIFNIRGLFSKPIVLSTISFGILFTFIIMLNNQVLLEKNTYYKMYELTKDEAGRSETGSISLRIRGFKFFYPYFAKTYYLGMGMMSSTAENNPEIEGRKRGLKFADLGLIALVFRFGIFSIIVIAVILTRIFKDLIFLQTNENVKYKIIATSFIYLFISQIIILPTSTIFFNLTNSLYDGIIFYIIYKLKSEMTLQDSKSPPVSG